MGARTDLEDLRGRSAAATTAEEALELNAEILSLDAHDGVALNRLGRAYQDLGYIDQAITVFTRAVALDPRNAIAQRRLRNLKLRKQRSGQVSRGPARDVVLRDPAVALKVLDGPWRSDCVALLADLLLFARRLDASRTIVRDVAAEDYFYVAGGAHASAGPWVGLMDCYGDSRIIEQEVINRVVAAGGRYRPETGKGHVPNSLRLQVPFRLIGALRSVLLPAMRDHIRVAILRGPPQHPHLHNQALLDAILVEATERRTS